MNIVTFLVQLKEASSKIPSWVCKKSIDVNYDYENLVIVSLIGNVIRSSYPTPNWATTLRSSYFQGNIPQTTLLLKPFGAVGMIKALPSLPEDTFATQYRSQNFLHSPPTVFHRNKYLGAVLHAVLLYLHYTGLVQVQNENFALLFPF